MKLLLDTHVLLWAAGHRELEIKGEHAVAIGGLPPIHKDPFDRILVAQSMVEGILLLTADPGPVRMV